MNLGAIAGTIVGALVLVTAAGLVLLHTYRRRQAIRARASSNVWAGLASKDFTPAPAPQRTHYRTHSFAARERNANGSRSSLPANLPPMPMPVYPGQSFSSHTLNPSDEDVTVACPSEEKLGAMTETDDHSRPADLVPIDTDIPPFSYKPSHHRRSSGSSSRSHARRVPAPLVNSFDSPTRSHRRSGDKFPPSSLHGYNLPPTPTTPGYSPIAPNGPDYGPGIDLTRSGSVGSSFRRARKPVPAYDPTEIELESAEPAPPPRASIKASASSNGHGPDFDTQSFVGRVGDLTKPVHYLMPDMPPSPRR